MSNSAPLEIHTEKRTKKNMKIVIRILVKADIDNIQDAFDEF